MENKRKNSILSTAVLLFLIILSVSPYIQYVIVLAIWAFASMMVLAYFYDKPALLDAINKKQERIVEPWASISNRFLAAVVLYCLLFQGFYVTIALVGVIITLYYTLKDKDYVVRQKDNKEPDNKPQQ